LVGEMQVPSHGVSPMTVDFAGNSAVSVQVAVPDQCNPDGETVVVDIVDDHLS
jgi:hypothetical protein